MAIKYIIPGGCYKGSKQPKTQIQTILGTSVIVPPGVSYGTIISGSADVHGNSRGIALLGDTVSITLTMQYYWRVLLVKNSTPGINIADNLTVQRSGTGCRIAAVLRKNITNDLVVQFNKNGIAYATMTVPASTPIQTEIQISISTVNFVDGEILSFDIVSSDSSSDANGIAQFSIEWVGSI